MAFKSSSLLLTVALLFAAATTSRALDLRNVLSGYSLTSWGVADGLPWSEVMALAQDADGYLWLGTDGGLVRFDGVRFSPWQAMPVGRSVRALRVTADGDLWVGLGEQGGIVRMRRSSPSQVDVVRAYGETDGLGPGAVAVLLPDRTGAMWAGTPSGLFMLTGERWIRAPNPGLPAGEVFGAYADHDGALLVSTAEGVFRAPAIDARFERVDGPDQEPVRGLSVDAHGRLWMSDAAVGFRARDSIGARTAPVEVGRGARLLHDRSGYLWVGTWGQGLWRVDSGHSSRRLRVERATAITGLPGNGVVSLLEDREGNIWVGTLDGLTRLTPYSATPLADLGLVRGVEVTPAGVFVATSEAVLLFPAGTTRSSPVTVLRVPATAMHADERGRLWVSAHDGLWQVSGDHATRAPLDGWPGPDPERSVQRHEAVPATAATRSADLPLDAPLAMEIVTSDRRGGLWLYNASRGLVRWSSGRVREYPLTPDLRLRRVVWMDTQRNGRLWLAMADRHIATIDADGEIQVYDHRNGLEDDAYRTFFEDAAGRVWLGSTRGLTRFADGRFATIRQANDVPLQSLTSIAEDGGGHLWVGTRSGIVRMASTDVDRALVDPSHRIRTRVYAKSDGLAGNPRWYGERGVVRDAGGRLWFVTSRGATVIDPDLAARTPITDGTVHIDRVIVDEQPQDAPLAPILASRTRRLDILFAAATLTVPAATHFRYRLDGFDADWIDAGTRRQASYTNLPAGDYVFRVMASARDGAFSGSPAAWSFTIEPMFYRTSWFVALCAGIVAAGFATAWRLHVRQVRKQFSLLLGERARLGREIHDTLLQGLFGVALRCDAISSEIDQSAPHLREHFVRIRRDVEEYMREARQSIWNLRSPKLEQRTLAGALRDAGEHLTASTATRFSFTAIGHEGGRCAPAAEEQLLRIGQEAVTNAVRHANASEIRMVLSHKRDRLVLRVSDNGRGFEPSEALATGGYGLTSMRERAAAAGGVLLVTSTPGEGTDVQISVPYEAVSLSA